MNNDKFLRRNENKLPFKKVLGGVNFPKLEENILKFWHERNIFHRTESERLDSPLFMMYEGPPTANGSPGIHHVLARVFKDCIPRYKTMKGFRAIRKGGWDTHGLPVELEVEKELGLDTKQAIEKFGVEEFNKRCRQSVFRYVKEWEELTDRIGFWVDMKSAYATLTNDYIESGWWILKQLWEFTIESDQQETQRLLFKNFKVTPHCPRCVTSLSSHEVALGYKENTQDPSVYVKFKIFPGWWHTSIMDIGKKTNWRQGDKPNSYDLLFPGKEDSMDTYLLVWTTTPWTLPSNTALAINPKEDYVLIEQIGHDEKPERLILAEGVINQAIKNNYKIISRFDGADLVGLAYEPLYDVFEYEATQVDTLGSTSKDRIWRLGKGALAESISSENLVNPLLYGVVGQDFVSINEGTGVLHIAPAFGGDDYSAGKEKGLFFIQPVDLQGKFIGKYPWSGKFVKDADKDIRRNLRERGYLYRDESILHTYPFCWRCNTPLLYYAKSSWYIRTTAVKERLISANEEINWHPDHIKYGRFGEWLKNNVDWAISRERFWGTPIPIWRCEDCGNEHCIGSINEIKEMQSLKELENLGLSAEESVRDLHRPYIDKIVLVCNQCGSTMKRIPEVLDAWFDSGAMPFAQWHYPSENKNILEDGRFPADYICEAVDQTRGWFYSLHAISTLLETVTKKKISAPSYKNVICLGLIQDGKGEKMSKSKGNVIKPWSVIEKHGADALRWYLYTAAPPGNSRRFSQNLVGEAVRQFMLTLWNTYSFFVTYANIDNFHPEVPRNPKILSELDRWITSELNSLILNVTENMENYNPTEAGRRIEEFVDILSNWYIRRSRRRFWKSENDDDKLAAHATLYDCLITLTKLIAPLTPFLAEEIYQNLVKRIDLEAPESVHLAQFPEVDKSLIDLELVEATRLAMRLSSLGRSARSKAKLKVRQPLEHAFIKLRFSNEIKYWSSIKDQIEEELNVKDAKLILDPKDVARFIDMKLNMALIGPKFGSETNKVANAFALGNSSTIFEKISNGNTFKVEEYELTPEDVQIISAEIEGYSTSLEAGYMVVVETVISDRLREEGFARELIHCIQGMRRSANFNISDHIITHLIGDNIGKTLEYFSDYIKQETLSHILLIQSPEEGSHIEDVEIDGLKLSIGIKRDISN